MYNKNDRSKRERMRMVSAADLTKQAIVTSMKELVSEKPFDKISVIEIAKRCGINRNTFYYYFKDKYDVLEWIFRTEIETILAPCLKEMHLAESVTALCEHMKTEKTFYTSALEDLNHRCLRQLLVDYYKQFLMEAAGHHFERLGISAENQELIARFYSHGTIGMLCDWARSGMKKDAYHATHMIELSAKEKFFA